MFPINQIIVVFSPSENAQTKKQLVSSLRKYAGCFLFWLHRNSVLTSLKLTLSGGGLCADKAALLQIANIFQPTVSRQIIGRSGQRHFERCGNRHGNHFFRHITAHIKPFFYNVRPAVSTTISKRISEYRFKIGFNFRESTASAATAGALMRIKPDGASKKSPNASTSWLID